MEFKLRNGTVKMDKEDALLFVGIPIFIGSNGYARVSAHHFGKDRYVHRIITGAGDMEHVDHINGDKTDNRRANLRLCTQQQNNCNQRLHATNVSGVPGVYWNKSRQQWAVQCSSKGVTVSGGRYDNLEDAISARRALEDRLHGEFAARHGVLNQANDNHPEADDAEQRR